VRRKPEANQNLRHFTYFSRFRIYLNERRVRTLAHICWSATVLGRSNFRLLGGHALGTVSRRSEAAATEDGRIPVARGSAAPGSSVVCAFSQLNRPGSGRVLCGRSKLQESRSALNDVKTVASFLLGFRFARSKIELSSISEAARNRQL
jgi:hypothetical protein